MENKEKQNNLPWIIVGVVVIVFIIFLVSSSNKGNTNQSGNSPTNSITGFFTPESDAQIKCKSVTQKAFDNWSGKLSKQLYDSIMIGTDTGQIINTGSTVDYKYNYNTDVNLCFMEYVFSWKVKKVSSGNEGQVDIKVVQTLFSDTNDPTTTGNTALATLATGTGPSGSQLVQLCSVMVPGHYDDPTQKPVGELLAPTQCKSESEFNSLVLERFGIK
ncbi:MAG: hypothetical protein NT068_02270 [Candidatus Nomurabacteria bacterium]|nr:hypothetical protein [Candidatus Nomurabacteria bacterium]